MSTTKTRQNAISTMISFLVFSLTIIWSHQMENSNAFQHVVNFQTQHQQRYHYHYQQQQQYATRKRFSSTQLYYNQSPDENNSSGNSGTFDIGVLHQRIKNLKLKIMEDDLTRPPNAKLDPMEFVEAIINALLHNEDPLPDSGFKLLLQCSTEDWISKLYKSIGAPKTANIDVVASALGTAISRPHNQFAILVGDEEENNKYGERYDFNISFPNSPLDYYDGTAWVQCALRDKKDNSLLVMTGWSLEKRNDGAWLIDSIDWQDFRDEYRPGIGREEWDSLCD